MSVPEYEIKMEKFKISYNASTLTGSREYNQDVFLADSVISEPESNSNQYFEDEYITSDTLKVFVVCDGVGMFKNSGMAAKAALEAVSKRVETCNATVEAAESDNDDSSVSLHDWVVETIGAAKEAMLAYCNENCTAGSSTISMLAIRNNEYVYANIGDSPAFLMKENGDFSELSLRHNLATLRRMLNEEPAEGEERVLLYHLGEKNQDVASTVNITQGTLGDKDAFLVCSDGVVNILSEKEIQQLLSEKKSSCVFVIDARNTEDSDNCTAITVYIEAYSDDACTDDAE